MMKLLLALFLFVLLAVATTQPVLAGGQMVSVYADPDGAVNNNGLYLRVIRVYLNPTIPCKGTTLTFHLSPPQDGDYITTGSGTSTYTMQEDRGNSGCNTYAKMGSMVKGVRQVSVDAQNGDTRYTGSAIMVHFDGEHHDDNESGGPDGYNYRSSIVDPYASNPYWKTALTPTTYVGNLPDSLKVNLLDRTFSNGPKGRLQRVTIKWIGGPSSNVGYQIFEKEGSDSNFFDSGYATTDDRYAGPSATIELMADYDWYIRVKGCLKSNPSQCITSPSLYLPKGESTTTNTNENVYPTSTESNSNTSNKQDGQQVDELNKKVASLEGKLAESEKKQSVLEQRIGDLVNFIKRLFPFFN